MTFLYCLSNVSLTQRILFYLIRKIRREIEYVTVIFFNDFWIVSLKCRPNTSTEKLKDCLAFFNENGIPYQCCSWLNQILKELDAGCDPTAVMNNHGICIVSHGAPELLEVEHFRAQFVNALGYCPPSLV